MEIHTLKDGLYIESGPRALSQPMGTHMTWTYEEEADRERCDGIRMTSSQGEAFNGISDPLWGESFGHVDLLTKGLY